MEENKERQDKKGSALSQLKAQREQKLRDGEPWANYGGGNMLMQWCLRGAWVLGGGLGVQGFAVLGIQ